jgi:hypothetical protein
MIFLLNPQSIIVEVLNSTVQQAARKYAVPVSCVKVEVSRKKRLFRSAIYRPEMSIQFPLGIEPPKGVDEFVDDLMNRACTEIDSRVAQL